MLVFTTRWKSIIHQNYLKCKQINVWICLSKQVSSLLYLSFICKLVMSRRTTFRHWVNLISSLSDEIRLIPCLSWNLNDLSEVWIFVTSLKNAYRIQAYIHIWMNHDGFIDYMYFLELVRLMFFRWSLSVQICLICWTTYSPWDNIRYRREPRYHIYSHIKVKLTFWLNHFTSCRRFLQTPLHQLIGLNREDFS